MIASSSINPITFKKLIGATLTSAPSPSLADAIGSLVDGTYYYRVSAVTPTGETLASTETSLAIAKLATPVNEAFTAGAGTLPAETYYYRVSAINDVGQTLASTETSFVLEAEGGVNVNWGAVTGATGYKVYGRTTGAELLISTVGEVTTYLDDGSITPEGALPTTNTTAGGITISWVAITGATGYKIYGRATSAELLIVTLGAVTSYLDNGTITPAGDLPPANTTGTNGNYPTMWNTLHAERKHGNAKIIPYYQKFKKDHVVYLQFTTDNTAALVLKSFCGNVQIESTTSSTYASSHGTDDIRYFHNFTVTLGASYYDKKVWFTLTQTDQVLTSEPIEILDLTEKIAKGIIKYIKYTNFDRNDSDLDERFIDWDVLPGTGHYLDFFIEANDQDQNNKDEVEVLQGSQTQTILSASYFAGRVLKTGPIPDYLAVKLAIVSSLDVFMVNGIQYIKQGGIESDRFGGSTLYQMSIKMIEKMTIGINVDNIGIAGTVVIPVAPPVTDPVTVVYPMYIGSVVLTPIESSVKLMDELQDYKSNQTKNYDITTERPCFAYPAAYGALVSITDNGGFEIISGFTILTLDFTQGVDTVSYKIYYFTRKTTLADFDITFKFT